MFVGLICPFFASLSVNADDSGLSQESSLGLGLSSGLSTPSVRPRASIGLSFPAGSVLMSGRGTFSYLSLNSNFDKAAKSSQYSAKLFIESASWFDFGLTVPEVMFWNLRPLYFSAAPEIHLSRVKANYRTPAAEGLDFSSWSLSTALALGAGYRQSLSQSLSLDVSFDVQLPLLTGGWSSIDYNRDNSRSIPTFVDTDLDQMLDSLQPYLEKMAKQIVIGCGIRLNYKF